MVFSLSQVDLTLAPSYLAELWGIGEFGAGMILSLGLVMAAILPVLILSKGSKDAGFSVLVIGFVAMSACVALSWLDPWLLILLVIVLGIVLWLGVLDRG